MDLEEFYDEKKRRHVRLEQFWSFDEFVASGKKYRHNKTCDDRRSEWQHGKWEQVDEWCREGWAPGVTAALPIAESALKAMESDHALVNRFEPQWGMHGSQPDVGRYLQGMPDDMIEFEPFVTSAAGKVVTLCSSFIYSGGIDGDAIIKRGAMVTALAMALEQSQHSVEIWIDHTTERNGHIVSTKVLVKASDETLDAGMVAYRLAHPTILRKIMFSHEFTWPAEVKRAQGVPGGMGMPTKPLENLPEGTIYLDHMLLGDRRLADPATFVTEKMKELGLIE